MVNRPEPKVADTYIPADEHKLYNRLWILICTLEVFASDHKCSAQAIFVKVQMFKPSFGGRVWQACKA
jgi:hypothetical protein